MSSKYNEPNLAEQTRITKVSTNTAENLLKAKLAVLKDRLNKRTEQIEEKRQEIDEMIQQEKRKNQENEDCDDFYEIIEKCKKGTCVVNKNKRNCCTDDDLNQLRKQLRKEYGDEQWTRKCIQNKKGGKRKTKRRRRRGGTKKKPNKKKTYKLKKKPPRRKPNRVYLTVHELPTIKESNVEKSAFKKMFKSTIEKLNPNKILVKPRALVGPRPQWKKDGANRPIKMPKTRKGGRKRRRRRTKKRRRRRR